MAELVDALDSGSSRETGGCSSHLDRTFNLKTAVESGELIQSFGPESVPAEELFTSESKSCIILPLSTVALGLIYPVKHVTDDRPSGFYGSRDFCFAIYP